MKYIGFHDVTFCLSVNVCLLSWPVIGGDSSWWLYCFPIIGQNQLGPLLRQDWCQVLQYMCSDWYSVKRLEYTAVPAVPNKTQWKCSTSAQFCLDQNMSEKKEPLFSKPKWRQSVQEKQTKPIYANPNEVQGQTGCQTKSQHLFNLLHVPNWMKKKWI